MRPWVVLVFAVSLLLPCESQGPSAVTPVFVQKGGDVLLKVEADVPEDFHLVEWKLNKNVVLVRFPHGGEEPPPFPGYTERIEFPEKKYSVKLKNLQEADSGVYTARVVLTNGDRTLAKYNVTVQDPVSPVELTVISVDSRSSECNLTVTCRTQDCHINSTLRCDNQTCSQEGGEQSEVTTSGASLHVYLSNGSIICNHSNQVSWTEDIKIIEHVSPQPDDSKQGDSNVTGAVVPVFVILGIIAGIIAGLYLYRRKIRNYNRESIENTVYEIPQLGTTAQPLDQSPTYDASGLSPTSTYCLVGPHSGPPETNKTRDTTVPESLYATVDKPARSLKN
ncbi:SLAM family member 7-like isoform X3 [Sebastes umbrosus]|uniref:SLAM family member 7-like isoform X3 n=1 Tax=Sebastes umbrosus TaxID=72105 RepID=UPI00189C84BC|nr:SLAM family member 7-like isoform X3 [Sebastes umbrosus]